MASGGSGEVWQGTDVVLGRPVAVKLLRADRTGDPGVLARFKVEARRAGSVAHENIARIFDYNDETAGQPAFLVMELVDGRSLAELLADGPLTVPVALGVVAQVAAAIAAVHEAGQSQLDIKPADILLSADGTVKIIDFGFGRTAGTEQAGDLYSLGVLGHECLCGEPPFTGKPLHAAAHEVRDLPSLPATIPVAVAELIRELTDKDPANRPGSAAVVASRAAALRDQVAPPGSRCPDSPG